MDVAADSVDLKPGRRDALGKPHLIVQGFGLRLNPGWPQRIKMECEALPLVKGLMCADARDRL